MDYDSIKLRLINNSSDANNSQVVIFQKNVATNFGELAIAWRVINNLGRNDYHPFEYSMGMEVCCGDSWGNFTPHMSSIPGESFHMVLDATGNVLNKDGVSASAKEVEVRNDLLRGAISANILKDGKLLAAKTSVAPGQKAVFEFKPTIFMGVASQVTEGKVMNSAIISSVNTELSLLGIASADIVMTGGGPGKDSTPFEFNLENIAWA
ncbi:MAG: hypothetical protein GY710_24710 [Desulfobacteraceae bacterium]|nr:hypothetical protein [Desulfobacteraceae bacterium]